MDYKSSLNGNDLNALYPKGLVVYSKKGRDIGKPFIVVSTETCRDGEYLYLVDGEIRKVSKPKRKKIKHVQPTKHVDEEIAKKLSDHKLILDAEFMKILKPFVNEKGVAELVER